MAKSLQGVEEECERPLAVRAALDPEIPFVCQTLAQAALDVFPSAEPAVVHPHQTAMGKGVAVVLAKGAFGGGAHVAEYQAGGGFRGDTVEVGAVPGGNGRCEDEGRGAKLGFGIETYAEAIGVVLASTCVLRKLQLATREPRNRGWRGRTRRDSYQTEPRVERLLKDGMRRVEDQLGEKNLVAALVDLSVRGVRVSSRALVPTSE